MKESSTSTPSCQNAMNQLAREKLISPGGMKAPKEGRKLGLELRDNSVMSSVPTVTMDEIM